MGHTADQQPVVGEAPGQEGLWICVLGSTVTVSGIQGSKRSWLINDRYGTDVPMCGSPCAASEGESESGLRVAAEKSPLITSQGQEASFPVLRQLSLVILRC